MSNEVWREFWSGGEGAEQAIGGAHRGRLTDFWREFFCENLKAAPDGALIADIASGAGAALAVAADAAGAAPSRRLRLAAFDISGDAVRSSIQRAPGSIGAVADGALLPLADRSLAIAVSQFGVEYAGRPAFAEIARCLAPAGVFSALSHYSGGAIDAECACNEALLDRIAAMGIFNAADAALKETYRRRRLGRGDLADPAAERKLKRVQQQAAAAVAAAPPSAAKQMFARLLGDLGGLAARRLAYADGDALGWLAGMEASTSAYRGRMRSMRAAALDARGLAVIGEIFRNAGFAEFSAAPLALVADAAPAAWVINARASRD